MAVVGAPSQSKRLERKKLFGDPILVSTIVVLLIFLLLFILYPLATLLIDSVLNPEKGFTLDVFSRVLSMAICIPARLAAIQKAFTSSCV